jgi:secretion/DNA translocation related CpaE-like protein
MSRPVPQADALLHSSRPGGRRLPPVVAPSAPVAPEVSHVSSSPVRAGDSRRPAVAVALVTRDPRLTAELTRLCAAPAVELQVATDRAGVLRGWRTADLVVVDVEMAEALQSGPAPRRADVVVVADDAERVEVWRAAARLGAAEVLTFPADERVLLERITGLADRAGEPRARTIGVVAGAGGAGASTLAVSICLARAQAGASVTLLDADPAGGGVDLLLGAESAGGARWPDLASTRGSVAPEALDQVLPRVQGVRFLSCGRDSAADLAVDAMAAVLPAARRSADLVVVDLPRRLDPAAEIAVAACDGLLVVTTARVRAVAATATVVATLAGVCADLALVVRTHHRSRLRPGEVSAALGLPLAGVLETDDTLATAADCGDLAAAVRRSRLTQLAGDLVARNCDPRRAE